MEYIETVTERLAYSLVKNSSKFNIFYWDWKRAFNLSIIEKNIQVLFIPKYTVLFRIDSRAFYNATDAIIMSEKNKQEMEVNIAARDLYLSLDGKNRETLDGFVNLINKTIPALVINNFNELIKIDEKLVINERMGKIARRILLINNTENRENIQILSPIDCRPNISLNKENFQQFIISFELLSTFEQFSLLQSINNLERFSIKNLLFRIISLFSDREIKNSRELFELIKEPIFKRIGMQVVNFLEQVEKLPIILDYYESVDIKNNRYFAIEIENEQIAKLFLQLFPKMVKKNKKSDRYYLLPSDYNELLGCCKVGELNIETREQLIIFSTKNTVTDALFITRINESNIYLAPYPEFIKVIKDKLYILGKRIETDWYIWTPEDDLSLTITEYDNNKYNPIKQFIPKNSLIKSCENRNFALTFSENEQLEGAVKQPVYSREFDYGSINTINFSNLYSRRVSILEY